MKNCKICKKEIKTDKNYCSIECFNEWLSIPEGNIFLDEILSRNATWYKIQIKQHKDKIKLFQESLKELEIEFMEKVGETEFNSLMSEIENEVD